MWAMMKGQLMTLWILRQVMQKKRLLLAANSTGTRSAEVIAVAKNEQSAFPTRPPLQVNHPLSIRST